MVSYGINDLLQNVATTGPNGFALENATPSVLTWTAPNDGQMHRVMVISELDVTSLQTGGAVQLVIFGPDGAQHNRTQYAGTLAAGFSYNSPAYLVSPGTTVTLEQSSAQTGGAAVLYAEIWAA